MLRCNVPNMAVRPQDGIPGLREGFSPSSTISFSLFTFSLDVSFPFFLHFI